MLAALWASPEPLTAGDVQATVDGALAYTTVTTILTRLHQKGAVDRAKVGRAFAYRPIVAESAIAAEKVRRLLDRGQDRGAVLQGLIDGLSGDEEQALRDLLGRATDDRGLPT